MRRDGDGYLFELGPDSFVPFSGAMVDLDALLELMEGNGIDVLVSSSEPLSVTGWQIDEAAEAARVLNEEKARAQERHPDRYVGLATLPLQDPERALRSSSTRSSSAGWEACASRPTSRGRRSRALS
jgi:predicted TIM-barrel fold metal-dependent hydrolase